MKIIAVLVGIFTSYCCGVCLFKTSSTSTLLMDLYNINTQQVGMLVSATGVVGLILSLPAGAIVAKYGARRIGLLVVASCFLGSLIGLLTDNFWILLATRFLEGVAIGTITAIVPPLIAALITDKKRPIYMGFFSCFLGVGQLIVFSLTNFMVSVENPESCKNLWILTSIIMGISLVLWFIFVKPISNNEIADSTLEHKGKIDLKFAFKNPGVWILLIVMFLNVAGYNGGTVYTMNYLQSINLDPLMANQLATIRSIAMIIVSVLAGIAISPLSLKVRFGVPIIMGIVTIIAYALTWKYDSFGFGIIVMLVIAIGNSGSLTIFNSISPNIFKDERYTGITNGFISVGQNIGSISVAFISGSIIDLAGFGMLTYVYIGFGIVILLASIFLFFSYSHINEKRSNYYHNSEANINYS